MNPGDEFGPYLIESVLGRGGMGTVYLATHSRLERKVALKLIASELADDPQFHARFLRESQLAASLDHPHVIPIYDADEIDGVLYLAMRYVDGPSLQKLIRDRGALTRADTLRIAEQIGGALDAAHHAELIHRDLKPANILLADGHAYLCDFGLAKRTTSQAMTQAGSFLGTVHYCSPEQIRGEPLDGRADVYSFGCVLYHCLSGEPPYARESDVAVLQAHLNDPPPKVSPDLDGVFAKAMAKDRDDRYATAGELAAGLRDAIAGEAPATVRAPTAPRRRRRGIVIAVVALLLALAASAVAILATNGSDDRGSSSAVREPDRERASAIGRWASEIAARCRRGSTADLAARGCAADRQRRGQSTEHPAAAERHHRADRRDGRAPDDAPAAFRVDRGRPPLPRRVPRLSPGATCPLPPSEDFDLA